MFFVTNALLMKESRFIGSYLAIYSEYVCILISSM